MNAEDRNFMSQFLEETRGYEQYQTTEEIEARILELASLIEVAETDEELSRLDIEFYNLNKVLESRELIKA